MSRPVVSKHVKVLDQAGVISIHTIGREPHGMLRQNGFMHRQEWISYFEGFWDSKSLNFKSFWVLQSSLSRFKILANFKS